MKSLNVLRMASLLVLVPVSHVAAIAQGAAAPAGSAAAQGYILGPNDEITMTVYGQADLSVRTRISSDGTVVLPLVGKVMAGGKTPAQLSDELSGLYKRGGYLTAPGITIDVTGYVSRTATVLGNVMTAGNYPLDRPYSIAAMVAKAGGARPDGANAVILTPADGSGAVRISLTDMSGAAARLVQPGDTIFVPAAEMVYVYGQVNQPGAVPYQPGLTYRQALARAGGPTLAGSTRKVEVRREGKPIKDAKLDDVVKPEDVLVIKEKLF